MLLGSLGLQAIIENDTEKIALSKDDMQTPETVLFPGGGDEKHSVAGWR